MRAGSGVPRALGLRLVVGFVVAAIFAVTLVGCYRVRNRLIATQMSPEDLYRCAQLELGRTGYAIVGSDRASGWLHAQRRVQYLLKTRTAEIYATVIPEESGGGSQLQLTDNSYAEENAEQVRSRCAPAPGSG